MRYKLNGENHSVTMRDPRIDALKAVSIIAVVLFHMGYLPFGYLGVDIFLVVNGYLIAKSMLRSAEKVSFSYIKFLYGRIVSIWPIVLVATAVCMALGYFTMLPDDYENLSETVVASNFFANNILACITTKNYWDVVNDYKPLMHMWYLGVVVQGYFVIGLVPVVMQRIGKDVRRNCGIAFLTVTAVSLALYLLPTFSDASKFYYLPFRLFEITAGAMLASCTGISVSKWIKWLGQGVALCILAVLLAASKLSVSGSAKLLVVCVGTVVLLALWQTEEKRFRNMVLKTLAFLGRYTLGIYIWHQILLAFFRYCVRAKFTFLDVLLILAATAAMTVMTAMMEQSILKSLSYKRGKTAMAFGCIALCALVSGLGMKSFFRAGVVRDVPELEISQSDIHRGLHAEYNSRGYNYEKDFMDQNNGKIRVLAVGDSFARDWVNILLESSIADGLEISYFFPTGNYSEERLNERIKEAEYVFYAVAGGGINLFQTI